MGYSPKNNYIAASGLLEFLAGCAMIACGMICVVYHSVREATWYGNWSGFWIGLTGMVGFIGGRMRRKCIQNGYLMMNVLCWPMIAAVLVIGMDAYKRDMKETPQTTASKWSYAHKVQCANTLGINNGTMNKDVLPASFSRLDPVRCKNDAASAADLGLLICAPIVGLISLTALWLVCSNNCECCGGTGREDEESAPEVAYPPPETNTIFNGGGGLNNSHNGHYVPNHQGFGYPVGTFGGPPPPPPPQHNLPSPAVSNAPLISPRVAPTAPDAPSQQVWKP